ncbi:MAG: hypothetical protein EXS31_04945 [Pedosphaera sp.]|nr:hypothetical protein [Pedosphaera sp.]
MKSFRFSLQALLTLRQRQENIAQEEYARTLRSQRSAESSLDQADRAMTAGWAALSQMVENGCTVADITRQRDYCRLLAEQRDDAIKGVEVAKLHAKLAMQLMLDARRQRELVDKTRDKQHDRHLRLVQVAEHKFNDEMAARRVMPMLSLTCLHSTAEI